MCQCKKRTNMRYAHCMRQIVKKIPIYHPFRVILTLVFQFLRKSYTTPQKLLPFRPRLDGTIYGKRSPQTRNGSPQALRPGFSGTPPSSPSFPDSSVTPCLPLPPLSINTGLRLTPSTWRFLSLPTTLCTSSRGFNAMTINRIGLSDLTSSAKINRTIKLPS